MANNAKPLTDEEIARRDEFKREVNGITLTEPVTCYSCRAVSVNGGILHCARCYDALRAENEELKGERSIARRVHTLMADDIARALRALGISEHARDMSPREVMITEVIPAIERLVSDLAAANERLSRAVEAIGEVIYQLESSRIWQGMKWGPPSPIRAEKALEIAKAALAQLEAPRSGATEEER